MAFLDRDDIFILEKDNGIVRLVSDSILQPSPMFVRILLWNFLKISSHNANGNQVSVL
jgi:hypothetical protein